MDNKKNGIPKLRFPGFTGAWEQRKLGEVAEINPSSEIPDNFEYVDLESVVGTEMIAYRRENKKTAPSRAQRLAKKGDIFYQTVRPYQKNNYHFNLTRKDFVFSTGYAQLRPNINGDFLFVYIQLSNFVNEVLNRSTGTSYPAISPSNLIRMKVAIPTNNEQEKIGAFFKQLDSLIALHQRKLEHLQEQKKGLLQKMFPKNGETVPEVRFPGFTDAWEQRKFSEFATYSGKRNKDNLDLEPYAITSDNGFIRQSEAHNEFGYMKNTDRAAYKIVQSNSFGYNPARINIGSIGYYSGDKNIIVSSLYEVFKTNQDVNDEFLWIWFKSNRFQRWINKLQEGSVRLYFYYDKLRETKIQLPNLEEQRQVADLFTNLDSLIALHQRKLDHLELMKKGLLQQMFV